MEPKSRSMVFDYRALRLLLGIIAFTLPFIVTLVAKETLSSISASYYTDARDAFVGMLFVVSALLWAYNGHSNREARASKVAAIAALFVAICPTAEPGGKTTCITIIHYTSAGLLFAILAYFCLVPFRLNTKGQKGKKGRRSKIYFICGCIMIACGIGLGLASLVLSNEKIESLDLVYWAETIALLAFGVAWIVAGKYLPPLVDKEEELKLFSE